MLMFVVRVQVKGKEPSFGPAVESREEAERQVAEIRSKLSTSEPPDLPWLAVTGDNIVSADIVERDVQPKFSAAELEEAMRKLLGEGEESQPT